MNTVVQTGVVIDALLNPDCMVRQTDLFDYSQWVLGAGQRLTSCFQHNFNLLLVVTGTASLETPHGVTECQAGSLVVLESVHYQVSNWHSEVDSVILAVSFTDKMIQRFKQRYADALIKAQQLPYANHDDKPLRFFGCDLTRMAMTALSQLSDSDISGSLLALKLEELLLLQLVDSQAPQLAKQLLAASDPATAKFRTFVENNYLNEWPLELFAKEFGVSLTAFKSLFNQVYGTSPRAWINERRLRYADELLRTSRMRIIEIAITAGFSSQSYFTQAYKARFGVTPTKVRQAS